MTAPAIASRRAQFTVTNPGAEPSAAFITALARMLLAHADSEIAAERERQAHQDQAHQDHDHGAESIGPIADAAAGAGATQHRRSDEEFTA